MRRKLRTILGAAAAALVFAAAGCSAAPAAEDPATPSPTTEPTPSPTIEATATPEPATPSPEPSYVSFGAEGPGALSAVFENGTGRDITQLQIKSSDAQDFGDNLVADGQLIAAGEMFRLYATPAEDAAGADAGEEVPEEASAAAEALDVQFNETFDVALTFSEGTQVVLYDLGFEDIDVALIEYEPDQNVAYVTYVSVQTAEQVSTLEAQTARVLAEAAAHEPLQEEADAAGQQSSSDGGQKSSSGSESSSSGGSGSSSSGNSESSGGSGSSSSSGGGSSSGSEDSGSSGSSDEGPNQSTDSCLDEDDIEWND